MIDHIVYVVSDLEEAMEGLEQKLGVRPLFGGYHKTQGTKYALINLTKGAYLEMLAIDDSNKNIPPPRWMGVDLLTKNKTTRWALKSNELERDKQLLKQFHSEMGEITSGSRNTAKGNLLKWKMILPLAEPEVEVLPFMVDWSETETHPSAELPNMNCELLELYAIHPEPERFAEFFQKLNFQLRIDRGEEAELKMRIKCPLGIVEL